MEQLGRSVRTAAGEREKAALGLCALLFLEMGAAYTLFARHDLLLSLVLHGLASCILAFTFTFLRSYAWGVLGGLISFFLPGYGLLVIFALLISTQLKLFRGGGIMRCFLDLLSRPGAAGVPLRPQAQDDGEVLDGLDGEMLIEMLDTVDLAMRRAILDCMVRRKERKLIARLVECQKDPRPEIYQYAQSLVSQLHEEFTSGISRARELLKKDPDCLRAHTELVNFYSSYLDTGLVDETLEEYYTKETVRESQEILRLAPRDLAPHFQLARIHALQGHFEEALFHYQKVLVREGRNVEARYGAAECYYHMKKYREMLAEIRTVLTCGVTTRGRSRLMVETAQWWLTA